MVELQQLDEVFIESRLCRNRWKHYYSSIYLLVLQWKKKKVITDVGLSISTEENEKEFKCMWSLVSWVDDVHLNAPCLHAVCRTECGRFSGETHRCIDGDKTLQSLKNMTVQPVSVFLIKNRKGGVHNMLSLHDLTCGLDRRLDRRLDEACWGHSWSPEDESFFSHISIRSVFHFYPVKNLKINLLDCHKDSWYRSCSSEVGVFTFNDLWPVIST